VLRSFAIGVRVKKHLFAQVKAGGKGSTKERKFTALKRNSSRKRMQEKGIRRNSGQRMWGNDQLSDEREPVPHRRGGEKKTFPRQKMTARLGGLSSLRQAEEDSFNNLKGTGERAYPPKKSGKTDRGKYRVPDGRSLPAPRGRSCIGGNMMIFKKKKSSLG